MTTFPRVDPAAPCLTGDADRFFDPARAEGAKAECRCCPSRQVCLLYALEWDVEGVWGGLDAKQRETLRERKGIVAKPLAVGWAGRFTDAHGTEARYKRHRRDGEDACGPCADAAARAKSGRGRASRCGSIAGYSLHRRHREPICDACQEAQRDWSARHRKGRSA